jgi:hypothetical protein
MVNLVLFTRIVINILINTIQGLPTTLVIIVGSSELLHKVLPSNTPLDPWPKFLVDPISTPPLIEFVLDATQISILVVGMTTLNNWVTSISTWCFHISTTTFLTLLVKLSLFEFDDAPLCGYPLVSSMVQNVDVNTPFLLCS